MSVCTTTGRRFNGPSREWTVVAATLLVIGVLAAPARAQQTRLPLTRSDAVRLALTHGARIPAAQADTLVAAAELLSARAFANPTLTASYTRSAPQYHAELDLPVPFPWIRRPRAGSAMLGVAAARLRYGFARASAVLDADTSYTLALAARARSALSARTAADADTLLRMAITRRDAGDASELDVELARVNAGQQANAAASDSLTLQSALLDLQLAIGLAGDSSGPYPIDSLTEPPAAAADTLFGVPLSIAAATASLRAATLNLTAERRSRWASPSLIAGVETHDPRGDEPGLLPVFGVALPLPLFDLNRGPIAAAAAERRRAAAELDLARLESRTQVAQSRREQSAALARIARGRTLVESANRVAAMSLIAYREGAATLPNVLEAQRNARDILAQYVDDLARAWIAGATLRALTLTSAPVP